MVRDTIESKLKRVEGPTANKDTAINSEVRPGGISAQSTRRFCTVMVLTECTPEFCYGS